MTESFLILLAGGVMYSAGISDPRDVTLQWLRLGGIIALALSGLATFFLIRRGGTKVEIVLACMTLALVLGQLAFVQMDWRGTQRVFALAAFACAVVAGGMLLTPAPRTRGGGEGLVVLKNRTAAETSSRSPLSPTLPPTAARLPPITGRGSMVLSAFGIATMCGIALMDMLLGHAYLTASKMTIAPFRRLNLALAVHLILRAIVAIGVAMMLQQMHPVYLLWGKYGLLILTRWLVGLAVPAVFVYMAHDCIKRRSTQSATGILYVAGVLIFIGELIALNLVSETGICF